MGTTIRLAMPTDAMGIARVHVASWRTTYPGVIPADYLVRLSPREYAERWRSILRREPEQGTYVAADSEHGILGFGSCGPQRTRLKDYSGEFYAIYLYDYAQGLGLGRGLMAAMAAHLVDAGSRSACVWVLRQNPARWFYERLGGRCAAEKPVTFAGAKLTEVAYGWPDLAPLARLSAGPKVR